MSSTLKKIVLSNRMLLRAAMYFRHLKLRKNKHAIIGKNVLTSFSSSLEGSNYIGDETKLIETKVGYASYISENSFFIKTIIGKYCSIGPNVRCVVGKHPSKHFVSTHPIFFSLRKQVGFTFVKEQRFKEFADPIVPNTNFSIAIGNDVWIGANVGILDGVSIGDGAIIAANALVNKDIEPYTIYGGVPAKPIKKRFEQQDIDFLMQLKWWNQPKDWIEKSSEYFNDIAVFRKKYENNEL